MRRSVFKVLSVILMVTIITGIIPLSSCSKSEEPEIETVAADTPWYECTETSLGIEYADMEFNTGSVVSAVIGKTDKGYVYGIQGTTGGYGEDQKLTYDICLYDKTGKLISKTDLADIISRELNDDGISYPYLFDSIFLEGNDIRVSYSNHLNETFTIATLDTDNDMLKDKVTYDSPSKWSWDNVAYRTKCGDKTVYVSYNQSSIRTTVKLLVMDKDGSMTVTDLKESSPQKNPGYIYAPVKVNDQKILLVDINTRDIFIFDLNNMSLKYEETSYAWLDDYLTDSNMWNVADDGNLYIITPSEICRADWDKKEVTTVTLLENIDISRNSLTGMKSHSIGSISDDSIELIPNISWEQGAMKVYDLTRSDSNPNAGKIIITTDGSYNFIYDAVYEFNRTDDEYFVKVVPNKYNYWEDITSDDYSAYKEEEMDLRQDTGSRLMVDLMAGECPDVVFYTTQFPQLNNGNCMLDLTSYYEGSGLEGKLFENIIDASKTDGKLYSMPLYFSVKGIMVDRGRYEGEGRGMTLDEFSAFTSGYCNGQNPIADSKLDFVNALLEQDYDLFVKDGRIDLDNGDFREIVEYAAGNVNDVEWGMNGDYVTEVSDLLLWFDQSRSQQIPFEDADMIGYPSPDRRGPSARIGLSVSITASSGNPEGAWRFVKTLLETECQLGTDPYGDSDGLVFGTDTPVNKEAFEISAGRIVRKYNDYLSDQYDMMGWGDAPCVTEADAEGFRDIIGSIDHTDFSDSDVEVIVYEELQAYFAGDRSLDDTIDIINSRVKILFDEKR